MSRPIREVVLSELAKQDLSDILQYTEQSWGSVQMDIYADKLKAGFHRMQEYPLLGKSREDWHPGCRCQQIEHHLVLYDITETQIRVARVLHEHMDVERHLRTQNPPN